MGPRRLDAYNKRVSKPWLLDAYDHLSMSRILDHWRHILDSEAWLLDASEINGIWDSLLLLVTNGDIWPFDSWLPDTYDNIWLSSHGYWMLTSAKRFRDSVCWMSLQDYEFESIASGCFWKTQVG